jgi:membrane dipeptidase
MRFIFDAHLDLSWNALAFDRDQLMPIADLRDQEEHRPGKSRSRNTVSLHEMRQANIGICLATVLARSRTPFKPTEEPLRTDIDYANQTCAYAIARGQLAYYEALQQQGHMQQLRDKAAIKQLANQWLNNADEHTPIGYILSMEGADPIISPDYVQHWWDLGLRTVCLAHYGPSAYAMGTGGDGPLKPIAGPLLSEFDRLGMILDLVHTADTALAQAMDLFGGPVFVSHGNCRKLVPGDRQISDEQIKLIAQRGGVIGTVLDAWMLTPDWTKGQTTNENTTMVDVANHIDHVCQLTGSTDHAAIGSDLDGGFGTEQSPYDMNSVSDLHKVESILSDRGYLDDAINAIMHGNWLRFFGNALP